MRKCTRPSPALPYCKQREAGQGPGNEAMVNPLNTVTTYGHIKLAVVVVTVIYAHDKLLRFLHKAKKLNEI